MKEENSGIEKSLESLETAVLSGIKRNGLPLHAQAVVVASTIASSMALLVMVFG